jgi:predicted TIM-barrel fold metal-dependent hydrolase
MVSRRRFLAGATAAGAAALVQPMTLFANAPQPHAPVDFKVPAGACDCHVHVIGDPRLFPLSPGRSYTPPTATVDELLAMHRALHVERVVIAQISIYGADNTCALDAMKKLGKSARGIAMIDDKTSDAVLGQLHKAGFRGVRLIFSPSSPADPDALRRGFQTAVDRVKSRNWHVQIYFRLSGIEAIKNQISASPVPVVFDHFAGAEAALGTDQPGFQTLLGFVKAGKAYVKLSAPYRASTKASDYPDVASLAKALIAANPERILWATDWPHVDSAPAPGRKTTDIAPFLSIDDSHVFNLLPTWAPDAAVRKMILVENPARLYGF